MTKQVSNAVELVEAAVRVMKARGMTEAEIVADLPRLATEAIRFLANK